MFERVKKKLIKITMDWAKEGVSEIVGEGLDRSLYNYREEKNPEEDELSSVRDYHSFLEDRLNDEIGERFEEMR